MTDALTNLPEASYDGLIFPVERADWTGGNDLVEHVAYRRPGADIEPTGRKAYRGSLTIPLINTPALVARYGELFPGLRFDLLTRFADRPIATLVHPTLGQITAAIGEVSEVAEATDRSGVRLTVQWIEHDASVALLVGEDDTALPTNASQNVERLAGDADKANAATAGYQATKATVASQVAFLDAAPRSFTQVNDALRQMFAPINANLALPSLAPASAHAARGAVLALQAGVFRLRAQIIPSPAQQRTYTTPAPMALWEVSRAVYGRADLGALVASANVISNPLVIPAGRTLTILPAPPT